MTEIWVYDTEAEAIERICEDNDVTEAELIERICEDNDVTEAELIEELMDYIDEIKAFHGWK